MQSASRAEALEGAGKVELVVRYREHAVNCLQIAKQVSDPAAKAALVDMAQVWATLADQMTRLDPIGIIVDFSQTSAQANVNRRDGGS